MRVKERELEQSLSNIKSVYIISGADRYLCFQALETLKRKICPNFPDLNIVNVAGDRVDFSSLIEDLQVCPFGDSYRLLIVNDFRYKKNASKTLETQIKQLEDYAKSSNFTTVLVFFNVNDEGGISIKNATEVDCSHLNDIELSGWIDKKLTSTNLKITPTAKTNLIKYTSNDLTRISSELDKLIAFVGEGEINEKDVDEIVHKDLEYKIFELAENIAKGNDEKVLQMLNAMLEKEKSLFGIISSLYNTYKRALFISINKDLKDSELATYLQIKEYAVKMLRNQVRVFSPKKLKSIVDSLADLDKNIKQGKIKDDVGLISLVINILMIRK